MIILPKDKYHKLMSSVENYEPVSQPATSDNPLHEPSTRAFETKPIYTVSDSEMLLHLCRVEFALAQTKF